MKIAFLHHLWAIVGAILAMVVVGIIAIVLSHGDGLVYIPMSIIAYLVVYRVLWIVKP